MIKPLYSPKKDSPMRIAGFMSGSGTNLVKIIEYEHIVAEKTGAKPYEVTLVFTDNKNSNAAKIADLFGLPLLTHDILDFYKEQGCKDKKHLSLRPVFDQKTVALLANYQFDLIALAGYMSIVTAPLLKAYDGRIINVHPADLTATDGGRRLYTGDNAVARAIKNSENAIYSSTHIVREQVDYGEILMVSPPVPVSLPSGYSVSMLAQPENIAFLNEIADAHQEILKEKGDWVVFPRTLELIAAGRLGIDAQGQVLMDENPIPNGYRE